MLKKFNNNDMRQNIYLYWDEKSGQGVIIDSGCSEADKEAIASAVTESNITVTAILLTHGHYDHIIAADAMKSLTGAKVCCHELEKPVLGNPDLNLSYYAGSRLNVTPDCLFKAGDVFRFGDIALTALHTPGHTPGGVCYYDGLNGCLFSGDTLFYKTVGRTDLSLGNHAELMESIGALLALPDETAVYPGHGRSTSIGDEKKHNSFGGGLKV